MLFRRGIDEPRRALRDAAGGAAEPAAAVLLRAVGLELPTGLAPGVSPAAARRAVEAELALTRTRRAFLFEYAPLMGRLGLRAAGIRVSAEGVSVVVAGPGENLRLPLNCLLVARSVVYVLLEGLPSVQRVELALFVQAAGGGMECVFSAGADRARARTVDPSALAPAQMARVFDVRAAQREDGRLGAVEPHSAWELPPV